MVSSEVPEGRGGMAWRQALLCPLHSLSSMSSMSLQDVRLIAQPFALGTPLITATPTPPTHPRDILPSQLPYQVILSLSSLLL